MKKIIEKKTCIIIPLFLLLLFFLLIPSSSFCLDQIQLPCEVLESSQAAESSSFNNIHCVLFHHADSRDRKKLSSWMKTLNGTEISFVFKDKKYKGVLFRLAHCFGRGLLVYTSDISPEKRDIIDILLPEK